MELVFPVPPPELVATAEPVQQKSGGHEMKTAWELAVVVLVAAAAAAVAAVAAREYFVLILFAVDVFDDGAMVIVSIVVSKGTACPQ